MEGKLSVTLLYLGSFIIKDCKTCCTARNMLKKEFSLTSFFHIQINPYLGPYSDPYLSSYMTLTQKKVLMKSFIETKFGYYPLV